MNSLLTVGTVVDTNDPQQMGRLRVAVPAYNDTPETAISDIPWASYMTPFGGSIGYGSRGPSLDNETGGPMAYGIWAIPKEGAQVIISCIDGNSDFRIWLGCLYVPSTPHTMPHGRHLSDDSGTLTGPLSSTEQPIQPIYDNYNTAFGTDRANNPEWESRGADFSAAAISPNGINNATSPNVADLISNVPDNTNNEDLQGYDVDRHSPEYGTADSQNLDSQTYSITTPGFHSFSMDDRVKNGRIRIRSTSGNQIILDDTNERIYISSAEGKNWIEMDQNGNIDISSDNRISIHAKKDINYVTEESFRVNAKNIHMTAEEEIRFHSKQDIHVRSESNTFMHSGSNMYLFATTDLFGTAAGILHLKSSSTTNIEAGSDMNIKAAADNKISGSSIQLDGGTAIVATAGTINLNGPPASIAGSATEADVMLSRYAYSANRIPLHEPYPRRMVSESVSGDASGGSSASTLDLNDLNNDALYEFTKDNESVNRIELGVETIRGTFWRR